jgi:hypothetical protein
MGNIVARALFISTMVVTVAVIGAFFYVRSKKTELYCFVGTKSTVMPFEFNSVTRSLSFDGKDISDSDYERGVVSFRYKFDSYINVGIETQDIWASQKGRSSADGAIENRGECGRTPEQAAEKKDAYEEAFGLVNHPQCKDEASTKAYFEKFTTDMIANASKIDPAKAGELQADMGKMTDGVKEGDYGALCTKLDDVRKKYGI